MQIFKRMTGIASRAWILVAASMCMLALFTGCTTISMPVGPTTPITDSGGVTGNWRIDLSPGTGAVPFETLRGSIDEQESQTSTKPLTASLQLGQPSSCFTGSNLIPFHGQLADAQVDLSSFEDVGQIVNLSSTRNASGGQFAGTFQVTGGCANATSGTLAGTKYAPLTGTYAGPLDSGQSLNLSMVLMQSAGANGNGTFNVSGQAALTGNDCFTSGTISSGNAFVVGDLVRIVFTSSVNASESLTVKGTLDAAADTITASSVEASGPACSASLGAGTLVLQ